MHRNLCWTARRVASDNCAHHNTEIHCAFCIALLVTMSSRNNPRWANLTCSFIALAIVVAPFIIGYRRGYDFEQMLGYFWANFGVIFVLLVMVALALSGIVAAANLVSRRTRLGRPSPATSRYVAAVVLGTILSVVALGFVLWHPLGYVWSIVIAVVAFVLLGTAVNRVLRCVSEDEILELQDKVMKGTEEPNEPARWVP